MQTRLNAGVTKGTVATVIPIPTPVNVTTTPSPNRLRFLTPLKSHEHHTTTTPKCQKKQNVKHHCRIFGKFRIFTPPSPMISAQVMGCFRSFSSTVGKPTFVDRRSRLQNRATSFGVRFQATQARTLVLKPGFLLNFNVFPRCEKNQSIALRLNLSS